MASSLGRPQSTRDHAPDCAARRQPSGSGSPVSNGLSEPSSTRGDGGPRPSEAAASTKKARRHSSSGVGSVESSGSSERPSTKDGVLAPARSAKVEAVVGGEEYVGVIELAALS